MLNLLAESLIRFDSVRGERVWASLPEVYAALMADEVASFPALRPHQRHAWHAFLVQVGAIAMHNARLAGEPPDAPDDWASLIRGLTSEYEDDAPWQLVVDDLTRPAFMQPPATSAALIKEYKSTVSTPDELDMLVTSKNHDVKRSVAGEAGVDDWLFALVTLQTMDGNPGRNYGISRMNGGHGSRPALSLAPIGGIGSHVARDIIALLGARTAILDDYPLSETGTALIWTVAWNSLKSEALRINELDPFYVEVCRRVRLLVSVTGTVSARRATTKAARIEAKQLNGRTGDPWTPINVKEGKSLTLASGGFTYKRVTEYLTQADWHQPILLRPTEAESRSTDSMRLVARAMVRGQGKTEGYYERVVPLRRATTRALGSAVETQDIGAIARERINQVAIIQRILSHAVQTFLSNGEADNASPEDRERARAWLKRLDEIVDADFFAALQDEFEAPGSQREPIHEEWLLGVVDSARELLRDACDTLPCRTIHRYRARTRAESLFEGRLRGNNGLPFLFAGDQR
ncbi:MAG: type I-E CRISPR-associated protein Cse1/CasA [Chloroflexi bacterium]|nr:type I-E CRISPR-associated protein Cse1/CasA [Chloroflexota bacterium]